jgi:RNA polymerase sigma-70 factor (ECF subfamily)
LALVGACCRGERAAWRRFVDTYGPRVYGAIRYFLRAYRESLPRDDALVIYQDLFLELCSSNFRKLKTFRSGGRLAAWLFIVARRRCLDHIRAATRKKRTPAALADQERLDSGSPILERADPIFANETRETVLKAMERLSPRNRLLLILFHIEGLSYAEISKLTGISQNSVSGMLKNARNTLARLLSGKDA